MAPAVTIDNTPDLDFLPSASPSTKSSHASSLHPRTLLLAPPSVASHPDSLRAISAAYDRSATDIQMLDRLALGLVSLPTETYDVVMLLSDVGDSPPPSSQTSVVGVDRKIMERLASALKVGGKLKRQNGGALGEEEVREGIFAGLERSNAGELVKVKSAREDGEGQTVLLRIGRKNKKEKEASAPNGVGFVNGDEKMEDEDEFPSDEQLRNAERIDPQSLLSEEDRLKPINIPEACKPNSKRRRACKDCTCGLAERLEAEDKVKRANADAGLAKLNANDLTEVDFTVQGKVGSCGNCALGDAFRCDGCPYIGLPAFKPGEEVRLLNNDIQL